jgi:hypothetical protein
LPGKYEEGAEHIWEAVEASDELLGKTGGVSEGFKKAGKSVGLFLRTLGKLFPYIAIIGAIGIAAYSIYDGFTASTKAG